MCSLCRLPVAKNHNFGQFLTFGDRAPFADKGQIWCATADPRYTLMCQNSSRSVYYVTLEQQKTPIFTVFWTASFSRVTNGQQSEKVRHGCTTINLSLSNGVKIISVVQRLHGKIGRTNSDVQKRDGQTNRQKP